MGEPVCKMSCRGAWFTASVCIGNGTDVVDDRPGFAPAPALIGVDGARPDKPMEMLQIPFADAMIHRRFLQLHRQPVEQFAHARGASL